MRRRANDAFSRMRRVGDSVALVREEIRVDADVAMYSCDPR
jgi:hypothetical protein